MYLSIVKASPQKRTLFTPLIESETSHNRNSAVTPCHTSQPPPSAPAGWQQQSGANWRQGDRWERGTMLVASSLSSYDAPQHGAWSMWKLPPRQGILFSHDYHHFALVFAPVPSSRAQPNWGPGQGSKVGKVGSTHGARWYIMMRETRIKLFRMTGAGNTKNILLCNNTNGKIANYPNPKTKYH